MVVVGLFAYFTIYCFALLLFVEYQLSVDCYLDLICCLFNCCWLTCGFVIVVGVCFGLWMFCLICMFWLFVFECCLELKVGCYFVVSFCWALLLNAVCCLLLVVVLITTVFVC